MVLLLSLCSKAGGKSILRSSHGATHGLDRCISKYRIRLIIFFQLFNYSKFDMSHFMLVGIQGSGKGTQARKILEKYQDYTLFEMGAELRRFAQNGTPDGEHVRSFLEQ